nr:IS3 family transposase [Anoxybacillus sp. UARK-01]
MLSEESTVNQIAAKYDVSPVVLSRWKKEFIERASEVFKKGPSEAEKELEQSKQHIAGLEQKVGQLTYGVDGLKKNLQKSSGQAGRKNNIDFSDSQITISRQAELLSINRSSVYRQPPKETVISDDDLFIMRRIDELHTVHPTWSYRTITKVIRRDDHILVNRQKIRRLMREMGMHTIYPKPHLSKRYHAQYIRPYLLRKLNSCRPDQVWGIDITYLRMEKGVMYLFVIIDWCSRCIVDYELSSTLEKTFVMNCLERALKSRKPEIMNRDQGSHFTNPDYLGLLDRAEIKVSMDGKGQALDNVRTERFFRTLKYDLIYPQEFETPRQLRKGITEYIHEYNTYRPHSAIGDLCPLETYNGREFCAA